MARSVITIKELGEETSWQLVRQAMGIPDPKMPSNYMVDKVALLLFSRQSLPERLCVTAAVRQMGGSTIYQGDQGVWRQEMSFFQKDLLPIFAYYMDCMYLYGFPLEQWNFKEEDLFFPLINAGSPEAHPAHALADIACMLRTAKTLKDITACWIGCDNGTLYSLLEAMKWFDFSLKICMPPQLDITNLKLKIKDLKIPVTFVSNPEEAVHDVQFIYAGFRGPLSDPELQPYEINPELMKKADKKVKLLLSASPIRAIPIMPEVLSSPASSLTRQAQYRLCVHKRILHWVLQ